MDPETVGKARRGDSAAVEALVRALTPELWRLAVHLSGDRVLAEDLVTEALYRGIAKLKKLREEAAVRGWFRKILVRRWQDLLRRRREAPLVLDENREPPAPESSDPVLRAESAEALELVAAEIAQLPPGQRAVLALRMDGVLSPAEIAKVLGTTADRVKANLWHGRRSLYVPQAAREIWAALAEREEEVCSYLVDAPPRHRALARRALERLNGDATQLWARTKTPGELRHKETSS